MSFHGNPCWFELTTPNLDVAATFYRGLYDWKISKAPMPNMEYWLAAVDEKNMVAGMMSSEHLPPGVPPNWLVYTAVDSADETARLATELGAKVIVPPSDIPNTGRFAVLLDPQGAAFGILQPLAMSAPPPEGAGAWNQKKNGTGNWLELMSTDPKASFEFYAKLFGWGKGNVMPMGPMGDYQIFTHKGVEIGGMMGLGGSPVPAWLPYFGVANVQASIDHVKAGGGKLVHGPMEVPGPALVAVAQDPGGAHFAFVGPMA